jgi:tRNA 2-thiouridine synthesizing protein D
MQIALHIQSAPYSNQGNLTALNFAKAALDAGHRITRIFFSGDAVLIGNRFACPPQDEIHLHDAWVELSLKHQIELILCVSACLRRGILDEQEAKRHGLQGYTVIPPFIISGLGQLVEAAIVNDHLITL